MSPITTEVLDTGLGQPAEGVVVSLARLDEHDAAHPVGHGVTNAEGRVPTLVSPDAATPGVYRLTFDTTAYFARSHRESFYPRIEITFHVTETCERVHVPLQLAPYGFATFRG